MSNDKWPTLMRGPDEWAYELRWRNVLSMPDSLVGPESKFFASFEEAEAEGLAMMLDAPQGYRWIAIVCTKGDTFMGTYTVMPEGEGVSY